MSLHTDPRWTTQLYLYAATARKLQPQQIAGMCKRTVQERLVPRLPVDFDSRYENQVPENCSTNVDPIAANRACLRSSLDESTREAHRNSAHSSTTGRLTFMNESLCVRDGPSINWYDDRFETLPLLWSLKLYAFEPLDDVVLGFDPTTEQAPALRGAFDEWISDWIDTIEIGRPRYLRRAWTPWAVSLRLQRWIQYAAWRDEVTDGSTKPGFETAFEREIYKNALFLRNHIEWDVGGNHLVENGIALLTAGLFFDDQHDWIEVGTSILVETGIEQFLGDGCHYERSPMYHVLTLTRLVTAYELLERANQSVPAALETAATDATAFLQALRPPDGQIPLLNDAVYGESLPIDACLRYAAASGIRTSHSTQTAENTHPTMGESGYRWLRTDAGALLFDGGPTGPQHLPGHSHSDTLSVLLWLDDNPVVTDTGTFGYVSGPRREYARSVRSHSTVQVGGTEPIEIGGKYLMGARPTPQLRTQFGEISLVEGEYDSASPFGPAYTHHRAVYAGEDWWYIHDTVTDHDNTPVTSRLPLHPTVTLSVDDQIQLSVENAESTGYLYPNQETEHAVTEGWYFPEFGVETTRPVVELSGTTQAPATVGVLITVDRKVEAFELRTDRSGPTAVELGDCSYRLPPSQLLVDS